MTGLVEELVEGGPIGVDAVLERCQGGPPQLADAQERCIVAVHLRTRPVPRVPQRADPQAERGVVRARPAGIAIKVHELQEMNARRPLQHVPLPVDRGYGADWGTGNGLLQSGVASQ